VPKIAPIWLSWSPLSSQRITPAIVIDPTRPSHIYAGTNAGLYRSVDSGSSWSLLKVACGGVWGVAIDAAGERIFIGDKDGVISRSGLPTISFSPLVDLGDGKVQSLLLDEHGEQVLRAAMWSGSDASVYRVPVNGGSANRLHDSLLSDLIPVDQNWPSGIPKPFPLTFAHTNGSAPSLFLASTTKDVSGIEVSPLWVSTVLRGVFVRSEP
jgi:hypothetical protein